jgi:hypothetical protein
VADINFTILGLIRDYHALFDRGINNNERAKERLKKLNDRVIENLEAYERNMHTFTLIINSFFWKSPEYTPFLEKDAIRNNFVAILNDFQKDIDKQNIDMHAISRLHNLDDVSF